MSLQQQYKLQLEEKVERVTALLKAFDSPSISVFESPEQHFRMRAEFRIWHDGDESYHIMFNSTDKTQYRVDELPAASLLINQAMQLVTKAMVGNTPLRRKLFQIDYLSTLSGELIITLIYHRQLDDEWQEAAEYLRSKFNDNAKVSIIGRARKQKRVIGKDYVCESLDVGGRTYKFKQIENSFTQPNALVNQKMIAWAIDKSRQLEGDLLELYCGSGNFSVPLAHHFRQVLGTEISKSAVQAAQANIAMNAISNLSIVRLSSEEFVDAINKVRPFNRLAHIDLDSYQFTTVLVDPPRAGLDADTLSMIAAYDNILYISCNPSTLADNLNTLCKTHRIAGAALFDQFPFTEHIEAGVLLQRMS